MTAFSTVQTNQSKNNIPARGNLLVESVSNDVPQKGLHLRPDSAGRIMITNVPVILASASMGDIETLLLKEAGNFETINYIYVVNEENKLSGVLSIKEFFCLPKTASVSEIMQKELIAVRPHTDQERVALLAIKHNLKAIPVINQENLFLGVVPSDVILNILHQEDIEDLLRSAGIRMFKDPARDLITASTFVHFKKRLPWLLVGLLGGLAAASLVGFFEHILSEMLILAAFIPAVVYMADAVGAQTQTIFIRSVAIDQKLDFKKYILREAAVGFFLATALGILVSLFSLMWWEPPILGIILGLSFFITIITAIAVAIILPWILLRWGYDPALASGPFATVIRDILSIMFYFIIADGALRIFPI